MKVEVYTKSGCELCDEGIDLIRRTQSAHTFSLELHDIAERAEWFRAYRYRVPVVLIDGREVLELRFREEALTAALVAAEQGL